MKFFVSLKKKKVMNIGKSEGQGRKNVKLDSKKSTSSNTLLPHVKYEIMFKIPTTITKYITFTSINLM